MGRRELGKEQCDGEEEESTVSIVICKHLLVSLYSSPNFVGREKVNRVRGKGSSNHCVYFRST